VPYWIVVNDNLAGVGAFRVSVVERCKFAFGAWVERLHVWFACLEVLVLFVKVIVSGGGCCPLACRHGLVCVGWVVVSPCCSTHVSPSCSCASAWSHSFCCLDCVLAFVVSGVVKLLSSSPSFLKKKKKKGITYQSFACSR
jgi:hypothetical protein